MVLRCGCVTAAAVLLSLLPATRSQNCNSVEGKKCCDPHSIPAQFCPNNIVCPDCGLKECECPEVESCTSNPWGNQPGVSGNCEGTQPEGLCTAKCAAGYKGPNGFNSNQTFKCDAQGKWVLYGDGGELICDGVKCEGPPIPHAVPAYGQFGDGKRIETTCAADFKQQSPPGDNHFVCDRDGHWQPSPGGMQCVEDTPASDCPAVPPVPYSRPCQKSPPGSTCTITCETGFILTGPPDAVAQCANGSWSGHQTLVCRPVPCNSEGSGLPLHARCPNNSTYNQRCFPTCASGFEPSDSMLEYVCGSGGDWTGDSGVFGCEPLPFRQPCTEDMWAIVSKQSPNATECVNVSFAAAISGAATASSLMWQEGFRFFQNHTNSNGERTVCQLYRSIFLLDVIA